MSQRRVLVLEGLGQGALCSERLAGRAISRYLVPAAGPRLCVPPVSPSVSPSVFPRRTFVFSCQIGSGGVWGRSGSQPTTGPGVHRGGSRAFGANPVPGLGQLFAFTLEGAGA